MAEGSGADTSSLPGKQLPHTMVDTTVSMSDKDYISLAKQCFELCSALKDKGSEFSLSLRIGANFNFSLSSSEKCSPKATSRPSRRPPSYLRRQLLRKAAFLEQKKKLSLANEATKTGDNNKVCGQEGLDLLQKKTVLPRPMAEGDQKEDETVDKDCPLNLDPTPSYPRESIESMESYDSSVEDTLDSESNKVVYSRSHPVGSAKQGSNCVVCKQTIVDKRHRPYPDHCFNCVPMSDIQLYNFFKHGKVENIIC